MNWPNWIVYPVLAFYAVPYGLRIAIAVVAVALIGVAVYKWVSG